MLGSSAQSQDALLAVMRDEIGTEQFGDLAAGEASHHVHLPEAVLRGDVSLSEEKVVKRRSFDGRDAVRIASDGNGCAESGRGNGAVKLRQGSADQVMRPQATDYNDQQKKEKCIEEYAEERPPLARRRYRERSGGHGKR